MFYLSIVMSKNAAANVIMRKGIIMEIFVVLQIEGRCFEWMFFIANEGVVVLKGVCRCEDACCYSEWDDGVKFLKVYL